jgi:hypothetical protein
MPRPPHSPWLMISGDEYLWLHGPFSFALASLLRFLNHTQLDAR